MFRESSINYYDDDYNKKNEFSKKLTVKNENSEK